MLRGRSNRRATHTHGTLTHTEGRRERDVKTDPKISSSNSLEMAASLNETGNVGRGWRRVKTSQQMLCCGFRTLRDPQASLELRERGMQLQMMLFQGHRTSLHLTLRPTTLG